MKKWRRGALGMAILCPVVASVFMWNGYGLMVPGNIGGLGFLLGMMTYALLGD